MDKVKDDKYYTQRMINYIDIIQGYYDNMKALNKKMQADDQDSDGIAYKFNQLREEAKMLSASFLDKNPELKMNITLLTSVRNRLIHDYENVTYSFFDDILDNDLPKLKQLLINALNH